MKAAIVQLNAEIEAEGPEWWKQEADNKNTAPKGKAKKSKK